MGEWPRDRFTRVNYYRAPVAKEGGGDGVGEGLWETRGGVMGEEGREGENRATMCCFFPLSARTLAYIILFCAAKVENGEKICVGLFFKTRAMAGGGAEGTERGGVILFVFQIICLFSM